MVHGRFSEYINFLSSQTPSGRLLSSSTYKDGNFKLLAPNPVQGGNYSCTIPVISATAACLHGNGAHRAPASYLLDKVQARLLLLEARQSALQKENDSLKAGIAQLREAYLDSSFMHSVLMVAQVNLSKSVHSSLDQLTQRVQHMEGTRLLLMLKNKLIEGGRVTYR